MANEARHWLISKYSKENICSALLTHIIRDFKEFIERGKKRIEHCKIIISMIQQNHCDWYLVDALIEYYIPNGIKMCQEKKYNELIEQCNLYIQADTPFADMINNIADTSFTEMLSALPTIRHRITIPEKYNTPENRKKIIQSRGFIDKVMTLQDYIDILTIYSDEDSLFVLEKINNFVADLEIIWQ